MPKKKTKRTSLPAGRAKKIFSWKKYFLILLGVLVLCAVSIFAADRFNKPECANSESCINDLSGNFEDARIGYFMGETVDVPKSIAQTPPGKTVLGESTDKHIYIDLTNQKLFAKEGGNVIYEFLISSGKWGRTPTGDFTTWIKLRYTRMKGGNKAIGTYYDLPNVPFVMYFYNSAVPKYRGYGIHGAYWHNNFGHPMSHGCINMKPEEAGILYAWANPQSGENSITIDATHPGTPITIYGTAPWN